MILICCAKIVFCLQIFVKLVAGINFNIICSKYLIDLMDHIIDHIYMNSDQ